MRTGKILGVGVGGLIALIVVALLAVWLLVNPNDYKPRIAAAVKDATGRDLLLQGDLKLAVFPWIALELGPASLGNPPGFSTQPFVSFRHASVRARFLPLLAKRLEVGRVEIDGLDLRLLKNAEGKGNWEGFGHPADTAPVAAGHTKAGGGLQGIAGIQITHARISYQAITLENFNLETGSFVEKGVVPVSVRFDVSRGVATEHASVDARLDFSADPAAERVRIAALNLDGNINMAGDNRPVHVSVSAPAIDIDIPAQTLSVPAFAVNAAGAHVSGRVQATGFIDAMNLKGTVTLAPLVVREYLARWGMTGPKTRDPRAWESFSASSDFVYGNNAVQFDQLQATLDDTHLRGSVGIANLDSRAVSFDLAVDSIDLDRYLAPPGQPAPEPRASPPGVPQPPEPAAPSDEAAKPLQANGTLSVAAVHLSPLDLSNVSVTVATEDRVMHIFPLKAQIDGGQYSGDITLDNRTRTPTVSLDEHLSGIDVGKLMARSKSVHVTGRGNVNLKAAGRGADADTITKTLNGHFEAYVTGGAVEGIDLGYELGRAEALIRHQDLPNAQNTKRTRFDAFKLSADIANGVATTHDLAISSQALKVTGRGSANLSAKTIDFALLADTLRTAGNTPIQIPVKVTGNIADPTVRPDIETLAKGALKQKLQEVLQDKLKGLFGKP
jgi:AsmA protein